MEEKNPTHYDSETEWENVRTVIKKSADKVVRNSKYAEERRD
jgi:hypothetical protein